MTDVAARTHAGTWERLEFVCFCLFAICFVWWCTAALFKPTCSGPSNIHVTETMAGTLQSAGTMFRIDHPGECPSVEQLLDGEYIEGTGAIVDACGEHFRIACDGRDVHVRSAGPDGALGTPDDLE